MGITGWPAPDALSSVHFAARDSGADAHRVREPKPMSPMKTAHLLILAVALTALSGSAFATSFAVLLGGAGDDKKTKAGEREDWIEINSITWASGAARKAAAGEVAAPAPGSKPAGAVARRAYEPVILTVPADNQVAALGKAFKKGRKLGTIRLRDGKRVLVLHDVVVIDVKREGAMESVSLTYTKIENANVPERARARMSGDPDRPVVTGRAPNSAPAKEKEPRE